MKNEYKISVIVPVYNAEKYLARCVDSILNQDVENLEIILCDDVSSDNSRAIMEKYKKTYPHIFKLIYMEKNSGGSGAINTAIQMSSGQYIIQVDNDDYLEPHMIKKLYRLAVEKMQILLTVM